MMFNQSEREWLENREYAKYHYSCQWCSQYDPMLIMPDRQNVPCMWYATCPCNTNNYDYKDALEFSERVAAKLAQVFMAIIDAEFDYELPSNCAACPCKGKCSLDCKDSIMKWARLEVEEEDGC